MAFVLALAGCGRAIPATQGGAATVSAHRSAAGAYLEDEGGHALYLFLADGKGQSRCGGACASVWPPYETSEQPKAGAGASQAKLGTIRREGGAMQVTYAGAPLYYYAGDAGKPGTTNGQGVEQFGALWYLVSSSSGVPVMGSASGGYGHGAGSGSPGGGEGGGY